MIPILFYIVFYYNIDKIVQYIYLPYVTKNITQIIHKIVQYIYLPYISINIMPIMDNDILYNNKELYFMLKITSYFMIILFSYTLGYNLLYPKIYDKYSIGLTFVYIKYIINILFNSNMSIKEYELSRQLMWVFTIPLKLKMYCSTNDILLKDINLHYHLLAIIPHTFFVPFKGQKIYIASTVICCIPEIFFLQSLQKYKHLPFTNTFILVWFIFIIINILDMLQLVNHTIIHALYNISDTLIMFIANIVICNYNKEQLSLRENMDLQSIQFVSSIINNIALFKKNNSNITPFCNKLIIHYNKIFSNQIPLTNNNLKLELLKKLLPFDLDKEYLNRGSNSLINTCSGSSGVKELKFICVMFMDIVNYTELAKKYSANIIFKLLDAVYNHFDTIIKKYQHLQKIESIGDAYMVVGDMYRTELNYKIVVSEIILLAFDFIKEIKTIKTPDSIPLSIRIGINMGVVNIGILGNEIPRLCVVGNTVNVAARLQSTADIDTIQLSRHIYEQSNEIDFEIDIKYIEKQNVFLKNIGSVTTYNITPSSNNIQ